MVTTSTINRHSKRRFPAVKAVALITSLSFFAFSAFSQDFTVKVPSPPTGCYSQKDNYLNQIDAAIQEVKNQTEQKENAMKAQAQSMTQEQKNAGCHAISENVA
jgi:hypothetical protein